MLGGAPCCECLLYVANFPLYQALHQNQPMVALLGMLAANFSQG